MTARSILQIHRLFGSSVQSQDFSLATFTALPPCKDVSKLTPAVPNYHQPFNARMKETSEREARSAKRSMCRARQSRTGLCKSVLVAPSMLSNYVVIFQLPALYSSPFTTSVPEKLSVCQCQRRMAAFLAITETGGAL